MLERSYVRQHAEEVQRKLATRGVAFDVASFHALDERLTAAQRALETHRAAKRAASRTIAAASDEERAALIGAQRASDDSASALSAACAAAEADVRHLLRNLPNLPSDDVPVGKGAGENVVLRTVGKPPAFAFQPKDHLALGAALGLLDLERTAKVSGTRFGSLLGKSVHLEMALVQFTLDQLTQHGFLPILPPVLITADNMEAMGYLARGGDAETYFLERDGMYLVGTAEQAIGPLHRDETFAAGVLPKRYLGFSTCFRREAGSYGKDTRGILRVHQFDKLEMFSFTTPEDADREHAFLLERQEALLRTLGLPYRVVQLCTGDLGGASARTYDLETWMPGQQQYRETHSTSTTTTYQSQALHIFCRGPQGKRLAHMLNGTAFAIGRILIAILENGQRADGSIAIPAALQPYAGFATLGPA